MSRAPHPSLRRLFAIGAAPAGAMARLDRAVPGGAVLTTSLDEVVGDPARALEAVATSWDPGAVVQRRLDEQGRRAKVEGGGREESVRGARDGWGSGRERDVTSTRGGAPRAGGVDVFGAPDGSGDTRGSSWRARLPHPDDAGPGRDADRTACGPRGPSGDEQSAAAGSARSRHSTLLDGVTSPASPPRTQAPYVAPPAPAVSRRAITAAEAAALLRARAERVAAPHALDEHLLASGETAGISHLLDVERSAGETGVRAAAVGRAHAGPVKASPSPLAALEQVLDRLLTAPVRRRRHAASDHRTHPHHASSRGPSALRPDELSSPVGATHASSIALGDTLVGLRGLAARAVDAEPDSHHATRGALIPSGTQPLIAQRSPLDALPHPSPLAPRHSDVDSEFRDRLTAILAREARRHGIDLAGVGP